MVRKDEMGISNTSKNMSPKVSIALPVFNGAGSVGKTIQTILDQTFTDFELIICDNASTDDTAEICKSFAEKDSRIRYVRNETNIGAIPNFNKAFGLATGEYFKWVGHDDWYDPDTMKECVEALDSNPDFVLCYWLETMTDIEGEVLREYSYEQRFRVDSEDPRTRFRQWTWSFRNGSKGDPIYGMFRRSVASKTRLIQPIYHGHFMMLSEMALLGPWITLNKRCSYRVYNNVRTTPRKVFAWMNKGHHAEDVPRSFPHWRVIKESCSIVRRADSLSKFDKMRLWADILRFEATDNSRGLARDVAQLVPGLVNEN